MNDYVKLKKLAGLTNKKVAELCGVSQRAVESWVSDGENGRDFPLYARNLLFAHIALKKEGLDLINIINGAIIDSRGNLNQWAFEQITGFCGVGAEGWQEIDGLNEMSSKDLESLVKNLKIPDYFFGEVDIQVVVDAVKKYRLSHTLDEFDIIHFSLRQ